MRTSESSDAMGTKGLSGWFYEVSAARNKVSGGEEHVEYVGTRNVDVV